MKIVKPLAGLLLIVLLTVPAISQEPRYFGPYLEDSFFPIGWSDDGKAYAYGWFEVTRVISNGSRIVINIQNVITDELLWQNSNTWDEGNVGDGGEYYPDTALKAWEFVAGETNEELERMDIWGGVGEGVRSFPMETADGISIEVEEYDEGTGYDVFARSDELGWKLISRGEKLMDTDLSVYGYVRSPDGTRVAVVMNLRSWDSAYSTYWVIGCHLSVGFGEKIEPGMP